MNEPGSDEALMAEVAKGTASALETLMRRYATPLLTFTHRMAGDFHQGEELFQEVFLAVWRKRHLYQHPRPFKTWLFAIAANRCRDIYRRTPVPALSLAEATVGPGDGSPVQTAMAAETATMIADAVAQLSDPQRAVVVLRIWQQMSYAEIGQVLDQPEATVRSHMHRGLCALRGLLEGRLGDEGC